MEAGTCTRYIPIGRGVYCKGSSPFRRSSAQPTCEDRRAQGLGSCGLMALACPVRSVGGAGDLSALENANRAMSTMDSLWTESTAAASAVNHKLPC